ncbi:MAG: prephenate dehydratase, partial [Crocinitomicaceae bacterium]
MKRIKVGIQGVKGAFHEIAARKFFEQPIEIVECYSFQDEINQLNSGKIDYALMAIENTVAGTLLPNYKLIQNNPVKIVGEEYLRVKQNLVALPGQKVSEIREVHSHYMAIEQCREFLKTLEDVKLVEASDTAQSAREIATARIKNRAGIASDLAAEIYGLEILEAEIETNKKNFTRFLVLTQEETKVKLDTITKASLCFSVAHEKGSLSMVLSLMSSFDMNLTKIQSLPILGKEFQYLFFVDVTFEDYHRFEETIWSLEPIVNDLQI